MFLIALSLIFCFLENVRLQHVDKGVFRRNVLVALLKNVP